MYREFILPYLGLNKATPVSSAPKGSTGYCLNVRPIDVLETRLRIGKRSGLKKSYTQQIGGEATPINWIGSVTVFD